MHVRVGGLVAATIGLMAIVANDCAAQTSVRVAVSRETAASLANPVPDVAAGIRVKPFRFIGIAGELAGGSAQFATRAGRADGSIGTLTVGVVVVEPLISRLHLTVDQQFGFGLLTLYASELNQAGLQGVLDRKSPCSYVGLGIEGIVSSRVRWLVGYRRYWEAMSPPNPNALFADNFRLSQLRFGIDIRLTKQ
jgi:hypothetical protein